MKGCPSTGLLLIDQGVTSTGLLLINRSRCHILYSCSSSQSTRYFDHISGVMFGVLASSAIDGGFDPLSGQTKDYKFGICCFSAKHAALRSRSKDWLDRERHVYPQTVVSVSYHYKNPTQRVGLVQSRSSNVTCSRPDIAEKLLSWR